MQSASSSSIKESKSVKKTPAKRAKASEVSKDSDKVQSSKAEQSLIDVMQDDANESEQSSIADNTSSMCGEDQTFGQGELKNVNEYLKGKVGTDIFAKHWLKDCELSSLEKSMVILALAYELCLAKDPDYDLENGAAENNKQNNFNTKRIFHILKCVTAKVSPEDSKKFTEFVCKSDNVKLLEMICKQEKRDEGGNIQVDHRYPWKGKFTGYDKLTDLLQYVLKQRCSPEIVLCIAEKVYGGTHILCNGEQYLDRKQVANIKRNFDYQDSVIEDCLKTTIELGYKNVVSVMLSGDIYQCIRLMKVEKFQEEFSEALDMIEEAVADVMSSWVNDKRQSFKDYIQRLLKEGIEVDIKKMWKLRLRKTVVGGLISTLFFHYQNELEGVLKDKEPFELRISHQDESRRKEKINELKKKISNEDFVKEEVLEKIKLLNSSSHISNGWFFREVLERIVNDEEKLGKLQAVCTAMCKEKVEKLLRGAEVHEDVVDALKLFGIKPNQTSIPKKIHSEVGVPSHFSKEIKEISKELQKAKDIVREIGKWSDGSSEYEILSLVKILLSDKTPAFSGLSRKVIIELKSEKYGTKKSITKDRTKELEKAVNQILGEIKKGIGILVNGDSEYCVDTEDIFEHFKIINSEIKKEDKREIVELVCQNGNVKLLEMICRQENVDGGGKNQVNHQYLWKGEFTGYEGLTGLLQYVLEQQCSSEIVLCIAEKVYGHAHVIYNGEQYLGGKRVVSIKESFNYSDSVIKDCLKAAIELGCKDIVPVMLGGDIYHCIRLMKVEKFQEEFSEALDMIEEAVADVMSSWVNNKRQSFKDYIQRLLKEGIEVEINKIGKKDLIYELQYRGIEVKDKENTTVKQLAEMLKKEGGEKVRLKKTVVGSLISTLFFNYRDELMKKQFELGITFNDDSIRKKEINKLKKKISNKGFVKEKVLEKIKLLNSSSHISNGWFFREVLSAIVNDKERFNKLKAVCVAICKEPMERLLRGAEIHEDVVDTLKFFGVDPLELEKSNVVANIPLLRISPPDSPGSKAAKKNNKYLMQNNYRRDGEFYYNAGTGSYLNSQNSPRGVGMLDSKSLNEKLSRLSLRGEDSELIIPNLPESETSTTLKMERSRSISPVPSVSKQGFNPRSSSTMRRAEGVAGNSAFDTMLDDKSISKSPTFLEREQEKRDRKSVERKGNSGYGRL